MSDMKIALQRGGQPHTVCELPSQAHKQMQILKDAAQKHPGWVREEGDTFILCTVFEEEKRVRDVWRYTLRLQNDRYEMFEFDEPAEGFGGRFADHCPSEIPKDEEVLAVGLESPHEDEYDKNFESLGPAQGRAGDRLLLLPEIFNLQVLPKLNNPAPEYHVVICNPVQFQTSLIAATGLHYPALRDRIWAAVYLWLKERERFLETIHRISPSIFINACTSGVRRTVTENVLSLGRVPLLFEAKKHACVWGRSLPLTLVNQSTELS